MTMWFWNSACIVSSGNGLEWRIMLWPTRVMVESSGVNFLGISCNLGSVKMWGRNCSDFYRLKLNYKIPNLILKSWALSLTVNVSRQIMSLLKIRIIIQSDSISLDRCKKLYRSSVWGITSRGQVGKYVV